MFRKIKLWYQTMMYKRKLKKQMKEKMKKIKSSDPYTYK